MEGKVDRWQAVDTSNQKLVCFQRLRNDETAVVDSGTDVTKDNGKSVRIVCQSGIEKLELLPNGCPHNAH